jgi:hypothetical protein
LRQDFFVTFFIYWKKVKASTSLIFQVLLLSLAWQKKQGKAISGLLLLGIQFEKNIIKAQDSLL